VAMGSARQVCAAVLQVGQASHATFRSVLTIAMEEGLA